MRLTRATLGILLIVLGKTASAAERSGFAARYELIKKSIKGLSEEAYGNDRDRMEDAIESLNAVKSRLRQEKTNELAAQEQLSKAIYSGATQDQDTIDGIKRARSISETNVRRIREAETLADSEIQRLQQKIRNTKPADIDSADFRIQQPPR